MGSHLVENLKRETENFKAELKVEKVGKVVEVFDGIAKASGLSEVKSQEMVKFEGGEVGVAFNLEEDAVGVIILGDFSKINEGDTGAGSGKIVEGPGGGGVLGGGVGGGRGCVIGGNGRRAKPPSRWTRF